jgi:type I restriction enzyme R subunit
MEAQAQLAQCEAETFWQPLTAERIAFLRHAIQPLFRVVSQADFKAMRFEKNVLEASLAHLKDEKKKYAVLTENLIAQVNVPPALSINRHRRKEGKLGRRLSRRRWSGVVAYLTRVIKNHTCTERSTKFSPRAPISE